MDLHWVPSFADRMQKSGSFMETVPLVTVLLNLILLQDIRYIIISIIIINGCFLVHFSEQC